jgi:hypothetical protein
VKQPKHPLLVLFAGSLFVLYPCAILLAEFVMRPVLIHLGVLP